MSQAQAVAGPDRLPWLQDDPAPQTSGGPRVALAGWAALVVLLIIGLFTWIGVHGWRQRVSQTRTKPPATTVALPRARPTPPPQPQVVFEPAPQVSPIPQREIIVERRHVVKEPARHSSIEAPTSATSVVEQKPVSAPPAETTAAQSAKPAPAAIEKPLKAWPAWQSHGASGRIVRVGAFGSREQAKFGWRYMVQAYPAVAHLKATVVGDRNSRGRHFFRFQIGTTSQAHSEVLCQRMERIRLSCAVVGLPWSSKGVER